MRSTSPNVLGTLHLPDLLTERTTVFTMAKCPRTIWVPKCRFDQAYSFSVCQKYLDDVVLIDDDEMRATMKILFEDLKLAVEPAGAAATAALLGPLKERCKGLKVGIIVCGANIDTETFCSLVS